MSTTDQPPRILVVMGPTASGKSGLAIAVAERLDGEIVSADAFAVYRGMNIGTDTPSLEARRGIPHHLLDILDPGESFSAGDFTVAADRAISGILDRRRLPIVVGGSHFYIEALLFGLFSSPPHDPRLRVELERDWETDPDAVVRRLAERDPKIAGRIDPGDRQRILRALEVMELSGEPLSTLWERHERVPRYTPLLAAPDRDRDQLYARIDARVDEMFAGGLVSEVRAILDAGTPCDAHALKGIGYREVVAMLMDRISFEDAVEQTKKSTRNLAKRQLTWLRNRPVGPLNWVPPVERGGADVLVALWTEFENGAGKRAEKEPMQRTGGTA